MYLTASYSFPFLIQKSECPAFVLILIKMHRIFQASTSNQLKCLLNAHLKQLLDQPPVMVLGPLAVGPADRNMLMTSRAILLGNGFIFSALIPSSYYMHLILHENFLCKWSSGTNARETVHFSPSKSEAYLRAVYAFCLVNKHRAGVLEKSLAKPCLCNIIDFHLSDFILDLLLIELF